MEVLTAGGGQAGRNMMGGLAGATNNIANNGGMMQTASNIGRNGMLTGMAGSAGGNGGFASNNMAGGNILSIRIIFLGDFNLMHDFQEWRSEEHTSELQSLTNLVCRLLLEKKKKIKKNNNIIK